MGSEAEMAELFGGVIGIFMLVFGCGMYVIPAVAFWRILSRVGHPGPMGLLCLIPIVNFGIMLWCAFGEWPIDRRGGGGDDANW